MNPVYCGTVSYTHLDYLTISSQSTIALNGLGRRDMTVGVTGV